MRTVEVCRFCGDPITMRKVYPGGVDRWVSSDGVVIDERCIYNEGGHEPTPPPPREPNLWAIRRRVVPVPVIPGVPFLATPKDCWVVIHNCPEHGEEVAAMTDDTSVVGWAAAVDALALIMRSVEE